MHGTMNVKTSLRYSQLNAHLKHILKKTYKTCTDTRPIYKFPFSYVLVTLNTEMYKFSYLFPRIRFYSDVSLIYSQRVIRSVWIFELCKGINIAR